MLSTVTGPGCSTLASMTSLDERTPRLASVVGCCVAVHAAITESAKAETMLQSRLSMG
jgi:hypothetical protein